MDRINRTPPIFTPDELKSEKWASVPPEHEVSNLGRLREVFRIHTPLGIDYQYIYKYGPDFLFQVPLPRQSPPR